MKVESIVLGSIGTNCYIVTNEETKECFAVDMAECPQEYVNYIKNNGLEMKALFLTHGHFDHIMGIDDFLKAFPVPVYAGEDELPVIEDDRLNVSCMYGPKYAFHGAQPVRDGHRVHQSGWNYFKGCIQDFVLWRTAIPDAQIDKIHDSAITYQKNIDCSVEIRCSVLPSEEQTYRQEAAASWSALYRRRS